MWEVHQMFDDSILASGPILRVTEELSWNYSKTQRDQESGQNKLNQCI